VIGDVKVGKNCWIGPFTILDGSGGLEIGDDCTISAGVHIYSHDNVANTLDRAKPVERSPVKIGSHVYLAPYTVVTRGVTIGDSVVVGAHALVRTDLPSGSKAVGIPAKVIGTV
jgi:acetyltransferase-like isoleucine patch superfamily enzyme